MDKRLNTTLIEDRMLEEGLSQTDLASKIGVTRTCISSWLKPEKMPRPRHILKLSEILNLTFKEILITNQARPQVAFRKSGNYKITDSHRQKFEYTTTLLSKLTKYLPFEPLFSAPSFIDPKVDYIYIQKVAQSIRNKFHISNSIIENEKLVEIFRNIQAVLVPVMWGRKHYKMATHIYLPDSQTTWVFANINANIYDFKFWLSHELGHACAPNLLDQEGEDFADSFAGELLFPSTEAKIAYEKIISNSDKDEKVRVIQTIAKDFKISPITIYKQIEKYIKHNDFETLGLEKIIYRYSQAFNSASSVSELLFQSEQPDVKVYIKESQDYFKTDFFKILRNYITENDADPKFVANLMDIPLSDAYAIFEEISVAKA
ncbi:MAG: helix-turn-helix domain-containing protein [Bdellovibrionaceae bacterium]|nr:helix-turn-helix domain-containing protein [Pseudobdellovibrionaceae bacterium]